MLQNLNDAQPNVISLDEIKKANRLARVAGRRLVTVRKIDDIEDIPNADLIKTAVVGGWKVVIKAGEFKPGDLCVFFEIDSFIPIDDARFSFLHKNKITWQNLEGVRLRTIRLKKQLSQGLALPLSSFPEIQQALKLETDFQKIDENYADMDFTELLKVDKWEAFINASLRGMAKGNFPPFIRKTDEERCVSANTFISTEIGPIKIIDLCALQSKPKVWSLNHITNKLELKSITDHNIMSSEAVWFKITLESGKEMIITDNHKVWSPDSKTYRPIRDFTIGMNLLTKD